jgi:hypothetical protein
MSNWRQDWAARSFIPRNCWPARSDADTIAVRPLNPQEPCQNGIPGDYYLSRRITNYLPEMYLQIESFAAQFNL